jgi:hypothetical protein
MEFCNAEEGIHKGSTEYLERCLRSRLGSALERIVVHPKCLDLAIVVVSQPSRGREVHGIPLSDSFRNVMTFFEPEGNGRSSSFERIQSLRNTALFDPSSLGSVEGPKLIKKGTLSL